MDFSIKIVSPKIKNYTFISLKLKKKFDTVKKKVKKDKGIQIHCFCIWHKQNKQLGEAEKAKTEHGLKKLTTITSFRQSNNDTNLNKF